MEDVGGVEVHDEPRDVSDLTLSDETPAAVVRLLSLPRELLVAILTSCDTLSLGRMALTCSTLADLCNEDDIWAPIAQRQHLNVEEDATAKLALLRAAICSHADGVPSNEFAWQLQGAECIEGQVQSLECRCIHCSRPYRVSLTNGFIDTSAFASKLLTRAEFRLNHGRADDVPAHQRNWFVIWDRRDAAALHEAMKGVGLPRPTLYSHTSATLHFGRWDDLRERWGASGNGRIITGTLELESPSSMTSTNDIGSTMNSYCIYPGGGYALRVRRVTTVQP